MSGPRLSITPAGAIFDRSLEPRDLHVLNLLGCHIDKSGWCRRSQVKMAKQLNCGRSSVQRSLDRLVEAGWVEKKRPPWANAEGQPSNSYMYRVVLDRDDTGLVALDDDEGEGGESHAEDATLDADCPEVGTPSITDGHPGAQPYVGTGAQPYVGTKNVPLERPPLERERDARARDRTARFIVDFEKRWPTAAVDDRKRTAYAAEALDEEQQQAALAGIAPFLDNLRRLHRKGVPAGWKYLEEKRWTLLEPISETAPAAASHPLGSRDARAIIALYEVARCTGFLRSVMIRNGAVNYAKPVDPKLEKLADSGPKEGWVVLTRQQAAAWDSFIREIITLPTRKPMREGDRAPWAWPPRKDGTLSETGPPDTLMTEQDITDFKG